MALLQLITFLSCRHFVVRHRNVEPSSAEFVLLSRPLSTPAHKAAQPNGS
jgi:hypothetical protein